MTPVLTKPVEKPMRRQGNSVPDPRERTPAPTPFGQSRDLRLDNVKGLLIVLVIIFHAGLVFDGASFERHNAVVDSLVDLMKCVRMPAFIFISGYLSSPKRGVVHAVSTVGIVLLLMHVMLLVWRFAWGDFAGGFSMAVVTRGFGISGYLLTGNGTLWYLAYLLFWRSLAPLFAAVRWPLAFLCAAFAVAVVVQTNSVIFVNAQVTVERIANTPFFLAGFYCRTRHWPIMEKLTLKGWQLPLMLAGFTISVTFCVLALQQPDRQLSSNYWAFFYNLGLVSLACFSIRLLLGSMTDRKTILSRFGATTLPLYMSHIFVMDAFNRIFRVSAANYYWIFAASVISVLAIFGHPWWLRQIQNLSAKIAGFLFVENQAGKHGVERARHSHQRHD